MTQRKMQPVSIVLFVAALFVVFFAFRKALLSSPVHDYFFYMQQWDAIIQGKNVWTIKFKPSPYGPVHSALALLYYIHFNLPRLFFVFLWLICSFGIAIKLNKNSYLPNKHKYALFIVLLLNPLFWVFVVDYGTHDILMAFFVLSSVVLFTKKKDALSGLLMAIAVSVKFIPLVMVPFLIFSRTRIRWRYAFSFVITLLLIFGVCYFLWGDDIFRPFLRVHGRPSKMLSVFRFIRGEISPLRLFTANPNFDWLSVYLCLFSVFVFFLIHIQRGFERISSSIISMVILVTLYKVGHHQFYITVTMLIVLWIGLDYKKIKDTGVELISVFAFIIWIAFVSLLYDQTNRYLGTGLREIIGLPTFLVSVWMLIHLIRYSYKMSGNHDLTNYSGDHSKK